MEEHTDNTVHLMLVSSIGIFFVPRPLVIFLFCIMVIVLGCIYPFLNTGVFYYENHGIETNFGVSRGFASLAYMIFAGLLGFVIADIEVMTINAFSVNAAVAMLLVLSLLPYYGSNVSEEKTSKSFKNNVLFKYPSFALIFIAVALLWYSITYSYAI